MSEQILKLLAAIDNGASHEVIRMHNEEGANSFIIIDRAIKKGNKELYEYRGYELNESKAYITEYHQYLFPYFESFIKGDLNFTVTDIIKKCVKNGNIDAIHSWISRYGFRIFAFSLKYQQYEIAKLVADNCKETDLRGEKYIDKLVKSGQYELFDKILISSTERSYSFNRCIANIFHSTDLDFIKKYYPCPNYPKLRYHAIINVLKTNNPEVMKYVAIDKFVQKLGVYDLFRSGNIQYIKKYCFNFRSRRAIRATCYSDSIEIVDLLIKNGVKLEDILYMAARLGSAKIVEHYKNELSVSDKYAYLGQLCRKNRDNFDQLIKIASIDDIIKKCISYDNFVVLHRIVEMGYNFSGKTELLGIIRDRQKVIKSIIEKYAV